MAFNGLRVIHGNFGDRLRYIMNPAKTEGGLLMAGINTTPGLGAFGDRGDGRVRRTRKDEARRVRQGRPTCRDQIRADIDRAIEESVTWNSCVLYSDEKVE